MSSDLWSIEEENQLLASLRSKIATIVKGWDERDLETGAVKCLDKIMECLSSGTFLKGQCPDLVRKYTDDLWGDVNVAILNHTPPKASRQTDSSVVRDFVASMNWDYVPHQTRDCVSQAVHDPDPCQKERHKAMDRDPHWVNVVSNHRMFHLHGTDGATARHEEDFRLIWDYKWWRYGKLSDTLRNGHDIHTFADYLLMGSKNPRVLGIYVIPDSRGSKRDEYRISPFYKILDSTSISAISDSIPAIYPPGTVPEEDRWPICDLDPLRPDLNSQWIGSLIHHTKRLHLRQSAALSVYENAPESLKVIAHHWNTMGPVRGRRITPCYVATSLYYMLSSYGFWGGTGFLLIPVTVGADAPNRTGVLSLITRRPLRDDQIRAWASISRLVFNSLYSRQIELEATNDLSMLSLGHKFVHEESAYKTRFNWMRQHIKCLQEGSPVEVWKIEDALVYFEHSTNFRSRYLDFIRMVSKTKSGDTIQCGENDVASVETAADMDDVIDEVLGMLEHEHGYIKNRVDRDITFNGYAEIKFFSFYKWALYEMVYNAARNSLDGSSIQLKVANQGNGLVVEVYNEIDHDVTYSRCTKNDCDKWNGSAYTCPPMQIEHPLCSVCVDEYIRKHIKNIEIRSEGGVACMRRYARRLWRGEFTIEYRELFCWVSKLSLARE